MEWPVPKTEDTSAIEKIVSIEWPLAPPVRPRPLLPQTRRHGGSLTLGTPGHSLPVGGGPHAQGMDGATGEEEGASGGADCGDREEGGDGRFSSFSIGEYFVYL